MYYNKSIFNLYNYQVKSGLEHLYNQALIHLD